MRRAAEPRRLHCPDRGDLRPHDRNHKSLILGQNQSNADMKKSSGGAFKITVDGRLPYSKTATGQFPTDEESLRTLG
jgi:hypothetical protein